MEDLQKEIDQLKHTLNIHLAEKVALDKMLTASNNAQANALRDLFLANQTIQVLVTEKLALQETIKHLIQDSSEPDGILGFEL